jgi:branched-chain amino acid transport system ATP-binding protein
VSRLEVTGVTKRFGGLVAVDAVSFSVEAGECVGLIGPNGAGKTTVFGVIAGEIEATAGTVALEERAIDRLPAHRRARLGLARTYQRLEVFPDMTVLDHLLVAQLAHRGSTGIGRDLLGRGGPTPTEVGRATAVLERLGLADHADRVVATLSLGTCRLVEMARALVTSPSLLLADEPSSGLDGAESEALGALLGRLRDEGLSIVLVEHDLDLVRQACDRAVVMDLGRVIADGAVDAVLSDEVVRAAYLGVAR